MEIEEWYKFTSEMERDFPEAQPVIAREMAKINEKYTEFIRNQSLQSQYGKPINARESISFYIDESLPKFEERFQEYYKEYSLDAPEENRFDSVRHHYPETEFERGDETLNSYAERFQNMKDEFKQKETSKDSNLEEKKADSFDNYADRFLALKGLHKEQEASKDSIEIPDASKEYDANISVEFGSTTQNYLRTSFRDTKEDLTVNKDSDMDRE